MINSNSKIVGGEQFNRPMDSIEVLNTKKPDKWTKLSKLRLPTPTYDHCTVALNRTTMFVTGGVGAETQAAILDIRKQSWEQVEAMRIPRSKVS